MRYRLGELGLPVPAWSDDPSALPRPYVAKAVTGGYDGRGVWFVDEGDPLPDIDLIVEERVSIVHELAIQVARTPSGKIRTWPVVETVQRDGICVQVVAPAPRLSPSLANEAEQLAITIATELDVVGVLTVELFEAPTGLVINELAMRPHNSGHWSIEGAATSQFEQHLRAVLDWGLGDTRPRAPVSVMVNLLGGEATDLAASLPAALAEVPEASVHLYGKQARPGRKLGHVTVLGDDVAGVRDRAQRAVDGIVMGSDSDWPTMRPAADVLADFGVPTEVRVVSAHRTPRDMLDYGDTAADRGLRVLIAGAGGAAHLPGMLASVTPLPVIGVPVPLAHLDGIDSLLSIVQMPAGVPVATVSVAGARNAGLLAVRILGSHDEALRGAMVAFQSSLADTARSKDSALQTARQDDA
jgi:phosphoribosylaminoimidazole carboxylase PurE protein